MLFGKRTQKTYLVYYVCDNCGGEQRVEISIGTRFIDYTKSNQTKCGHCGCLLVDETA